MRPHLVIGDPHLKLNRLDDAKNFLDELTHLIKQGRYDEVIILGDLFDSFAVVRSEVLALWSKFFIENTKNTRFILLVGNHDMAGADGGVSSLEVFKHYQGITVVDEPSRIGDAEFLPFMRSNEEFARQAKLIPAGSILFCHQSFNGAQFENGMYDPHGADITSVSHLGGVISGHVHLQQRFANIWYPGAPFQHTFGDAGHAKGVFEISLSKDSYTQINFIDLDMPTFKVIEAQTVPELLENLPSPNNRTHYKVVAKGAPSEIAQFWANERVKAFKTGSKRVVDALTSINPTAQVIKVQGTTQAEKLKSYVESKTWRTNHARLLERAKSLAN